MDAAPKFQVREVSRIASRPITSRKLKMLIDGAFVVRINTFAKEAINRLEKGIERVLCCGTAVAGSCSRFYRQYKRGALVLLSLPRHDLAPLFIYLRVPSHDVVVIRLLLLMK